MVSKFFFFFNYTATTGIYTYGHTRSLHDALPICCRSDGGLEYLLKALARQALGYPLDPPLTEQRMLGEQLRTRVLEQLFQALCAPERSEEHTSKLQSLMRNSYAVFCLKTKKHTISKAEHELHTVLRRLRKH